MTPSLPTNRHLYPPSHLAVSDGSSNWSLNPSMHALDQPIPWISADECFGTPEFGVGGDDARAFSPIKVAFVTQGSCLGL